MKITREINGQMVEIELTFSELINASEEYDLDNAISDIESVYAQNDCHWDLTKDQLKDIAQQALHNLSKNDNYSEAYWDSFNQTFNDYINEFRKNILVDEDMVVESWEDMKKKYPMEREDMDVAVEEKFVEDCFKLYEKEGFSPVFWTLYSQNKDKNGQPIEVLGRCTTDNIDLETLPMWKIKFPDGEIANVFPEEIIPSEMRANGCCLFDDKDSLADKIQSAEAMHDNQKTDVTKELSDEISR